METWFSSWEMVRGKALVKKKKRDEEPTMVKDLIQVQ